MIGRIVIEDIRPEVDCGQFTARAVAGETVPVEATIFRDGHNEVVAAAVRLTGPGDRRGQLIPLTEVNHGLHQWRGEITLPRSGSWSMVVEAWTDEVATWRIGTQKKLDAGRDIGLELEEGALLLEEATAWVPAAGREVLTAAAAGLRNQGADQAERLASAYDNTLVELLERNPPKDATRSKRLGIWVDRPRALYGSWYEFFPRSTRSATLTARARTTPLTPAPTTRGARGRSARRPAATTPSTPTSAPSTTSTPSWLGRTSWAWRSPSTTPCSARPTTLGSGSTRTGSGSGPTARSPMPRTRPRSTRTSTR